MDYDTPEAIFWLLDVGWSLSGAMWRGRREACPIGGRRVSGRGGTATAQGYNERACRCGGDGTGCGLGLVEMDEGEVDMKSDGEQANDKYGHAADDGGHFGG